MEEMFAGHSQNQEYCAKRSCSDLSDRKSDQPPLRSALGLEAASDSRARKSAREHSMGGN
jgi:hypothetical protein